jgi:predicted RNA binding protein YcfA (HicA-like mRNA interferase family)
MSKLKLINSIDFEKLLYKEGFLKTRQVGSHAFYKHSDGRYTTLPHHGKDVLPRPLIRTILREIGMSIEEYNEKV